MMCIQGLAHSKFSVILEGLKYKEKWSCMRMPDPLGRVETPVVQVSRADVISLFPLWSPSRQLFCRSISLVPIRNSRMLLNPLVTAAGSPPEV